MATAKSRIEKQELWRSSFDTTVLIKRLNNHALGLSEMTQTQIAAAKILLGKTIPDLKAVEVSGDPDKPLAIEMVRREIV